MKRQILEINSGVLSKAQRMRMFAHPVTCAIDCNDREYYGKRVSKLMVGGRHRNGTFWFYRSATLCVVEKGMSGVRAYEFSEELKREVFNGIHLFLTCHS